MAGIGVDGVDRRAIPRKERVSGPIVDQLLREQVVPNEDRLRLVGAGYRI